jgi:hypothetical protein
MMLQWFGEEEINGPLSWHVVLDAVGDAEEHFDGRDGGHHRTSLFLLLKKRKVQGPILWREKSRIYIHFLEIDEKHMSQISFYNNSHFA